MTKPSSPEIPDHILELGCKIAAKHFGKDWDKVNFLFKRQIKKALREAIVTILPELIKDKPQ